MRSSLRAMAGPVQIGTAVWCAAGHVTVAEPDSAAVRLVTFAPAWVWIAAVAAAALVGKWRRDPLAATPALLATVPWWPMPLPAMAFIWTGRLAWLPIIGTLWTALWFERPRPEQASRRLAVTAPWQLAAIAGVCTMIAGVCAAWVLAPRLPGGDEPHYLVITQSLLADGDLRIENNHRRGDYRAYFAGDLRPDYLVPGADGQVYSIHAPGTSVLALPAFAVFGYRGAQVTMLIVAGLTAALAWGLGWLATGDRQAAWFSWAAVSLSFTFLYQSVTIFPDGPGALGVALALLLLLRLRIGAGHVSTAALVATSAALAALPWLHTRFAVLSAALGLLIGWALLAESARPARSRLQRVAAFLVVPALSAAAWLGFFYAVYGTPNPAAPYGPNPETSITYVPGGMLALLFDEQFGLLTCAPALLVAVGAGRRSTTLRPLWGGVAAAFLYLGVVATYWMWYAGVPATPARFAMAVLPAFAAPVAVGWHRAQRSGRALGGLLLMASLLCSAMLLLVDRGALAWNVRFAPVQWAEWLSSSADVARGLPSFFWRLAPGDVATEGHFVVHVAASLAVFTAGIVVTLRLARRLPSRGSLLALAGWLGVSMLVLQTGWWLNGVSGLSPSSSQLDLLDRAERGAVVYAIRGWSIGRLPDLARQVRIRLAAPNGMIPPELSGTSVADLAAGVYELTVTTRRSAEGSLAVRLDRNAPPLASVALHRRTTVTMTVELPSGARSLLIEPDKELARVGQSVEAVPLRVDVGGGGRAIASAAYGAATVFFTDRSVFVEPDGFWIKGGQTAEFVVAAAGTAVALEVTNGGAANDVVIQEDGATEQWAMRAGEVRRTARSATARPRRFRVTSPAGFRPSAGGDHRYLGVRVRLEP